MNTIKALIAALTAVAISSSAYSANCAKNPNHSSCQNTVTVIDTSGLPTVVNGDGTIIGKAFNVDWETYTIGGNGTIHHRIFADVRLSKTGLGGREIGYALRFYSDGVAIGIGGLQAPYNHRVYWTSSDCSGAPAYLPSNLRLDAFAPFLDPEFIVFQHNGIAGQQISLLRVLDQPSTYYGSLYYLTSENRCATATSTGSSYNVYYPVSEGYVVSDGYAAPITFVPSALE